MPTLRFLICDLCYLISHFLSFGLLQKITTITVTVNGLCVFCVTFHLHKWQHESNPTPWLVFVCILMHLCFLTHHKVYFRNIRWICKYTLWLKNSDFGVFNLFLLNFSEDEGHILRTISLKWISEYFFIHFVNLEHMKTVRKFFLLFKLSRDIYLHFNP